MKITMCECCGNLYKMNGENERRIVLYPSRSATECESMDLCPECFNDVLDLINSRKRIYDPEEKLLDNQEKK